MSTKPVQLLSPVAFRALLGTARSDARVIPIDGSWYMPNNPRDPKADFIKERLENAKFFDLDAVIDKTSPYPHMLPTVEEFNSGVSRIGLKKTDKLIVYDKAGNFSAPRVAWTFQVFGHKHVYLLNNYLEYEKFKYPIEHFESTNPSDTSEYKSSGIDREAFVTFEQFYDIVSNEDQREKYNILDARSHDRFTGEAPEPRPGLPSGHAPGAKSLPFSKVLGVSNLFLEPSVLKEVVKSTGFDPEKPTIVMCGTGVTACILKAALDSAGLSKSGIQVYDGSWTEYAQRAGPEMIIKGE